MSKVLTFPTKEEIIDEREDEGDAFYWILQVTEYSVLIEGQGNEDSWDSVEEAYFEQIVARYPDSHAVRNQRRWRWYLVYDEIRHP